MLSKEFARETRTHLRFSKKPHFRCYFTRATHSTGRTCVFYFFFCVGFQLRKLAPCSTHIYMHIFATCYFIKLRLRLRQLPRLFLFHAACTGKCYCSPHNPPHFLNLTVSVCLGWARFVYFHSICTKLCRTHTLQPNVYALLERNEHMLRLCQCRPVERNVKLLGAKYVYRVTFGAFGCPLLHRLMLAAKCWTDINHLKVKLSPLLQFLHTEIRKILSFITLIYANTLCGYSDYAKISTALVPPRNFSMDGLWNRAMDISCLITAEQSSIITQPDSMHRATADWWTPTRTKVNIRFYSNDGN